MLASSLDAAQTSACLGTVLKHVSRAPEQESAHTCCFTQTWHIQKWHFEPFAIAIGPIMADEVRPVTHPSVHLSRKPPFRPALL